MGVHRPTKTSMTPDQITQAVADGTLIQQLFAAADVSTHRDGEKVQVSLVFPPWFYEYFSANLRTEIIAQMHTHAQAAYDGCREG